MSDMFIFLFGCFVLLLIIAAVFFVAKIPSD